MSEERLRHHKHSKEYPDWSASSAERKDFRRAKMGPEVPRKRKVNRGSRKWCGRKEGREHSFVYVKSHRYKGWVVEECEKCGKMGRMWSKYPWGQPKEIPEKVQLMLDNLE